MLSALAGCIGVRDLFGSTRSSPANTATTTQRYVTVFGCVFLSATLDCPLQTATLGRFPRWGLSKPAELVFEDKSFLVR
jgi:hypothetical protein